MKHLPDQTVAERIGELLFRYRGYTPLPLISLYFYVAQPTAASLIFGNLVIALGESSRLWAIAYTGRPARGLSIDAATLVTDGPFAWIRNPLYFSNMIIYSGVVLCGNANPLLWLPLTALYFACQYYFIIRLEEKKLMVLFGEAYREYCEDVPAYFPSPPKSAAKNRSQPLIGLKQALVVERSALLQWAVVNGCFLIKWLNAGG